MKLSIIIPTIGRETLFTLLSKIEKEKAFLPKGALEVVVVFDGKMPALWEKKIKSWQALLPLAYTETGKRLFAAGARNKGISMAKGDIIYFLGDDTIPEKGALQKVYAWHKENPQPHKALLGKVHWRESEKDLFYRFLEEVALFDFKALDAGRTPSWRHFYTSNISLKSAFLGEMRFSEVFSGWGFEDIELGYRLYQKGLRLFYDPDLLVIHEDPQDEAGFFQRMLAARENAKVFSALHPEVDILPKGTKKVYLKIALLGAYFLGYISLWWRWWYKWKYCWLYGKIP